MAVDERRQQLVNLIESAKQGRGSATTQLRSVIRGVANDGPDCAIIRLAETLLAIRDEDLKAATDRRGETDGNHRQLADRH